MTSTTSRKAVPGFVPWECGGGAGYRPGDRVHVEGEKPHFDLPSGPATVVDAYDRASDAWSPYCAAVRVHMNGDADPKRTHEFFVQYDIVERLP